MAYIYETHMHTSAASACGRCTGRDHAHFYRDLGFQGVFVTDHFFGGNTAIDRGLPWREYVNRFCRGYEETLNEGLKVGLDVFFGWEQGYGDDEYLVFGPDKDWLTAHPQIAACSRAEQLRLVHEGGGCVLQAHPFRMRGYMHYVRLGLPYCDGIEVANAANRPQDDACARSYAQEYHLVTTAGSDNHHSPCAPEQVFGTITQTPIRSSKDFAARVLAKEAFGLYVPDAHFDVPSDAQEQDAYWIQPDETLVPTGKRRLCTQSV